MPDPYPSLFLLTGNDVWNDGCYNIKVWVNSYGISWNYEDCYSNSGIEGLTFNWPGAPSFPYNYVLSPDVIIMKEGTDFYALVVYYAWDDKTYYLHTYQFSDYGSNYFYLDDLGATPLMPGPTSEGKGNYIRIDGNMQGQFVIVLDNLDDQSLMTITGEMNSGPQLNGTYAIEMDGTYGEDFYFPDVAISETDQHIYYTYVSSDLETVYVTEDDYSSVALGTTTYNLIQYRSVTSSGDLVRHPRIACPNNGGNSPGDWTVVWEHFIANASISDVEGMSKVGSTVYDNNYTDGSSPIGETCQYEEYLFPVVAYENNSVNNANNIQVCWYGQVPLNNITLHGISADETGAITVSCYQEVSDQPSSHQIQPSLAGRHGQQMNVAFYHAEEGFVYQKDYSWGSTFRSASKVKKMARTFSLKKEDTRSGFKM